MQHTIDSGPDGRHGPLAKPMAEAIQSCVHCGFCLAACPTYTELGQEMDSPRGRIVLMKNVLEGQLEVEKALPHVDRCLGCLACEPACPSGVAYRDLISPFRALANDQRKRSFTEKLRRTMVSQTLPYPRRFRAGAKLGRIGKQLSKVLPTAFTPFRPMLDLLPDKLPAKQTWPALNPAKGTRRARVALLVGCAQQVLDPDINTATIDVLNRNGVEVVIPEAQGCCGALSWHVGDLPAARKFAIRNLEAFSEDSSGAVDAIITNAAGCGSGMHEYHLILGGTEWEQQVEAFRHRVMDVTAFLAKLGNLEPIPDSGQKRTIAYHDACHLANAQGITAQPRELLRRIPGATIVEIPNSHLCCGSAGTYNIDQPDIARSLGRRKASDILATRPDLIATGNIGCQTQIKMHLKSIGDPVPIRHTIQIIRAAYDRENY